MEIVIRQAILHLLDSTQDRPVLADRVMELTAETEAYLKACIERLQSCEDARLCRLQEGSAFGAELHENKDFVDLSRRIAGVLFDYMHAHPSIPCADVAIVDYDCEGSGWLAILKLNYRVGYSHLSQQEDVHLVNRLLHQRACLPSPTSKPEEGALVGLDGTVRLLEKRYELDGKKDFYLSSVILECTQELPDRKKLDVICQAATQAVENAYTEEPHAAEQVAVMLCNHAQEQGNQLSAESVRRQIEEEYPLAAEPFAAAVQEAKVSAAEPVAVTPARIRRLESRCIKTAGGIEIRIPAELIAADSAVEFITDPDGSVSMLIRDVIL